MNRDDIIRMVNKAGGGQLSDRQFQLHGLDTITNFAALVASAEREACAKVCETHGVHPALNVWNGGPDWYKHGKDCAKAIRARGQA